MHGRIKNKGKFAWSMTVLLIITATVIFITQAAKENQNKDDNILRETSENYVLDNSQTDTASAADITAVTDVTDIKDTTDTKYTKDITENTVTEPVATKPYIPEPTVKSPDIKVTQTPPTTSAPAPKIQPPPAEETTGPPVKAKNKVYLTKFDALRAKYNNNKDIIGILKIPGTPIFYPVAHYKNNTYYLTANLYKRYSDVGSIFMDYEDSIDRSDPNTILYGHQMYSTNTMFHSLRYYTDETYFKNHRYVIFNTVYEDNVWEVFSFMITNTSFYYIQVRFKSEDEFLSLASEIKNKSLYDTDIDINPGDRILLLSTCTNQDPNTRYVLAAKLIKNKNDVPKDILRQMNSAIDDYIK